MDLDILAAELTRDEGRKRRLYYDTKGIPTIGVGRNLRDRNLGDDEIDLMLANDIKAVQRELRALPVVETLDPVRQRVLANLDFNMGIKRLLGFKRMIAALERGDMQTAAAELLDSQAARELGTRYSRLAHMLRTGQAQ